MDYFAIKNVLKQMLLYRFKWRTKERKTSKWSSDNSGLHFHDMKIHQKFLIEKYGTNDEPSTTQKELFFDIETEMGDALTVELYSNLHLKKVTSIAWYDKQVDEWGILILDTKNQLEHTKAKEIKK